jgi:hypothetical protein
MTPHHEVPTHLNVEDRVVFGLSVRQFLYMLVGSSASYTLWDQSAALALGVRVGIMVLSVSTTLAFALLKPGDRALEEWIVALLVYLGSPRRSTWQPAEPEPLNWRPAGAGWQELAPSLSWAEEESAACE